MAGGMSIGAGEGLLGGTLGGIGDIVSAASYQRPKLKAASGMELRLRQLAQNQLLGGGQELLGGTALYNQMAPLLMSQLPGMHYVPPSGGGMSGGSSSLGGANATASQNSPLQSYGQAVGSRNNRTALQQQLEQLKAQIKGTTPGGGRLKGLHQQQKQLQKQLKGLPPQNQLDRAAFLSGTNPDASLYNISMGPGMGGGIQGQSSQGLGDTGMNLGSSSPSLGAMQGFLDGLQTGQPHPDFLSAYYGAGGSGMGGPTGMGGSGPSGMGGGY